MGNDIITVVWVTFSASVPVAAVVLKYSPRFMVVPVDRSALNPSLAAVPTHCMVNVNFPPLGFSFKPPKCFLGSTMFWVEGLLERHRGTFKYHASRVFNTLPSTVRSSKDNHEFRRLSKAHYVLNAVNRLTEQ